MKMKVVMPEGEREALIELLDAGSIVPRPLPNEAMFMLMPIQLKARLDEIEERQERACYCLAH
jgi:hypothetical protein